MAKLVDSKDRALQQGAASCLVIYATSNPRRDAILPVLRWLSDPEWLRINGTQRAWFMQSMDQLEIPESVPVLIWIVENEKHQRQSATGPNQTTSFDSICKPGEELRVNLTPADNLLPVAFLPLHDKVLLRR
jgi:hypothetical protein